MQKWLASSPDPLFVRSAVAQILRLGLGQQCSERYQLVMAEELMSVLGADNMENEDQNMCALSELRYGICTAYGSIGTVYVQHMGLFFLVYKYPILLLFCVSPIYCQPSLCSIR
jgi:hypothetical protein